MFKWYKKLKKQNYDIEYQAGFGWAFSAYYMEHRSIADIESHTHNKDDAFDRGIHNGLITLINTIKRNA